MPITSHESLVCKLSPILIFSTTPSWEKICDRLNVKASAIDHMNVSSVSALKEAHHSEKAACGA